MIRSIFIIALVATAARAQSEGSAEIIEAAPALEQPAEQQAPALPPSETAEKTPDESITAYRAPFDLLTERMLGSASKPVRFDWRKTTLGIGATTSQLTEMNNFRSARFGGLVRFPFSGLLGELAITRVVTWDTGSSRKLARTPYRQAGRPDRFELDFNLSFPLAEGVVTAWPSFFPAAELVFSATGALRYLFYPGALAGASFRQGAGAILSPRLLKLERNNLNDEREAAMAVDQARYGLLAGFTTDVYFQNGVFVSPRVLMALPLLAGATGTQLFVWWELSLGAGVAF